MKTNQDPTHNAVITRPDIPPKPPAKDPTPDSWRKELAVQLDDVIEDMEAYDNTLPKLYSDELFDRLHKRMEAFIAKEFTALAEEYNKMRIKNTTDDPGIPVKYLQGWNDAILNILELIKEWQ